jgi:AcrR family transcriptional regulator
VPDAAPAPGSAAPRRPVGRPRDAATDGRVLAEALTELARNGIAHFSTAAVARRAGVARGTVDLRWPDREALIGAALETTSWGLREPDTGSLRGDIEALVHQWGEVFRDGQVRQVILRLQAEADAHPGIWRRYAETVGRPAWELAERSVDHARERAGRSGGVQAHTLVRCLVGALLLDTRADVPWDRLEREIAAILVAALEADA